MESAAPKYLTPEQLVARWENVVSKPTLANWRARKGADGKPAPAGPAFTKIGGRVLYPLDQVEAWEKSNMHAANDNKPSN